MEQLQLKAMDIVLADPAVAGLGSSVGASGFNASVNRGRLFISLKPLDQRGNVEHAARGRAAARPSSTPSPASACSWCRRRICASAAGRAIRNISSRCGAPISTSCKSWVPQVQDRVKQVAGRHRRHHRPRARRLAGQCHHRPLGGGAPRRAHPGYRQRAQRRVFAAADLDHLHPAQSVSRHPGSRSANIPRDPNDLTQVYVPGAGNTQVPLSAVAHVERGIAPLVVNHQGQFPSVTITYNIAPNYHDRGRHRQHRAGGGGDAYSRQRSTPTSPATCRRSSRR